MAAFLSEFRVRYAETDMMGIVHHSNYFVWFEAGRSDMCRALGVPYTEWEKQGVFLPLVEAHCRYKSPAEYDELLVLETVIEKINSVSVTFGYRLTRKGGGLVCEGRTKHAFTGTDGKLLTGGHPLIEKLKKTIG